MVTTRKRRPKRKRGRAKKELTPKFGARAQRVYLAELASGLHHYIAAERAGVSLQTVRTYRKTDPAFCERETEAVEKAVGLMENSLFQQGLAGSFPATQFYLCNKAGDRWKPLRRLDQLAEVPPLGPTDLELKIIERRERVALFRQRFTAELGRSPDVPELTDADGPGIGPDDSSKRVHPPHADPPPTGVPPAPGA